MNLFLLYHYRANLLNDDYYKSTKYKFAKISSFFFLILYVVVSVSCHSRLIEAEVGSVPGEVFF